MKPVNEFKRVPQHLEVERLLERRRKDKIYIGSSLAIILALAIFYGVMG